MKGKRNADWFMRILYILNDIMNQPLSDTFVGGTVYLPQLSSGMLMLSGHA